MQLHKTNQLSFLSIHSDTHVHISFSGSLSDGEVVALVFGMLALAAIILGVVGLLLHHKRREKELMMDRRQLTGGDRTQSESMNHVHSNI